MPCLKVEEKISCSLDINKENQRSEHWNRCQYRIPSINNSWDAVDTARFAGNQRSILNKVTKISQLFSLTINIKKIKVTVVTKKVPQRHITIGYSALETLYQFKYLGCTINDQCYCSVKIRSGIEKAWQTFMKIKNLFSGHIWI